MTTALTRLLDELATASQPLTVRELARRFDTNPTEVTAMIDALRAAGLVGSDDAARAGCGRSRHCSGVCPGPDDCPLVADLGIDQWLSSRSPG